MAIANLGTGLLPGDNRFSPRGTVAEGVRKPESEQALQEAALHPLRRLTPGEIGPLQAVYSQALGDVESLRTSSRPVDKARMFPFDDDARKVRGATRVSRHDEPEVKGLKKSYHQTFKEARRDRAQAERLIDSHGPGRHQLPGGATLDVTREAQTGYESVTARAADGQSRTVELSNYLPDYVATRETRPDGSAVAVSQLGSMVLKESCGSDGTSLTESYYLHPGGTAGADVMGTAVGGVATTRVTTDGKAQSSLYLDPDTQGQPSTLAGSNDWWNKLGRVDRKVMESDDLQLLKAEGIDPGIKRLGGLVRGLGSGLASTAVADQDQAQRQPQGGKNADQVLPGNGQWTPAEKKKLGGKVAHTAGSLLDAVGAISGKVGEAMKMLSSLAEKIPALKPVMEALGGVPKLIGDVLSFLGGGWGELGGRLGEVIKSTGKVISRVGSEASHTLSLAEKIKASAKFAPGVGFAVAGGFAVKEAYDAGVEAGKGQNVNAMCDGASAVFDGLAALSNLLEDGPLVAVGGALCAIFALTASIISHYKGEAEPPSHEQHDAKEVKHDGNR